MPLPCLPQATPVTYTLSLHDALPILGLNFAYMLTDKVGVELLAATPFSHDVGVTGVLDKLGSIKHLPPTVSLVYYPLDNGSAFQPYVGAGVNFTCFFDE